MLQEFPLQQDAAQQVVDLIRRHPPQTRVYLSCELVGSEPVLQAVCSALDAKVRYHYLPHALPSHLDPLLI